MTNMAHRISSLAWLCLLLGVLSVALPSSQTQGAIADHPTATVRASRSGGSKTVFVGRSLPEFDQELFLGIKYADQPVRFTPSSLKTSYAANDSNSGSYDASETGLALPKDTVLYNATQYGYECPGYGSDETKLVSMGLITLNEDCLNLNIIRPTQKPDPEELLPVMIWIFGGGWQQGATADPSLTGIRGRYNMSYILRQGALNDKPVLGVSINYRVAAFGFLDSEEVRATGNNNLGLRDQRVAMRWVKENIKAFGGDPDRVTIWGESAGAYSVGAHLVANGGDNEGLFRAAIMESGNAVGPPWNGTDWHQPMYDRIVNKTGCSTSSDTLQCLREVPYTSLYDVANEGLEWFAAVDGTFIKEYPQISYTEGRLAKVPILLGSNTDEGTSFGTTGTNTDEDCINQLISSKRWVLNREEATRLLTYYPNDPALGCPYGWGNVTWPKLGLMYKRYESMAGDLTMAAPRRLLAQTMAKYTKQVYSYRWDVPAMNTSSTIGVGHFAEIPFVFANPVQNITPLGTDPARLELGNMAARMWTSFVTDLNPNGHRGIVPQIPQWPKYTPGKKASNFVFRLPMNGSYVERDDYRLDGMDYINSIAR
ncbi:putative triacylglycerol lipase (LipA) [Aspergillus novofumigatus IBT 16806]|uniref:Carboxylic ester hydrolase n=1 Tax=Aspergillus novofumigatus (strain IBT 16806) TaxID=1392255 RepID=A0A2I1C6W6_ASPN1|nr:carboxylesterase family protein [Aspergillus novofumigatus IBT 16806]PKX93321.1 carboxylesterase family protein [Aspergillus novofumigatus IBT 16806]